MCVCTAAVVPTTARVVQFLERKGGMVMGVDLAYMLDEGAAHEMNSFLGRLGAALRFMYSPLPLRAEAAASVVAARL